MAKKRGENQGYIPYIVSMLLFSSIGLFRKSVPLTSLSLAFYRSFSGCFLILLVYAFSCFCSGSKKNAFVSLKTSFKGNIITGLFSGVAMGLNWIFLFESYSYTSVAVATCCYYLAPVIVILLSPLLFKEEKFSLKKIAAVLVALLGSLFISGILSENGGEVTVNKGVIFACAAAVLYAFVMILNKKMTAVNSYERTIMQMLFAFLTMVIYFIINGNYSELSLAGLSNGELFNLAIICIVNTAIAYCLFFGSLGKMKPSKAAVLSYIDPLGAILLSITVLHESLSVLEIIGGALIILASFII